MIYNTDAIMKAFEEGKDFEDIVSAFESAVTDVAKEYNEKQKAKQAKDNLVKDYAQKAVSALFDLCDVVFPDEMKEKYSLNFVKNKAPEEIDRYADIMIDSLNEIVPMLSFCEGLEMMTNFLKNESENKDEKECCGNCTDCHCCPEIEITPEDSNKFTKTTFFESPKSSGSLEDILNVLFKS